VSQIPIPPIVDRQTWQADADRLREREKAATRELDAIAAQRRHMPVVELPTYVFTGEDGTSVTLADVFDGRTQLIVYNHMWADGAQWQCSGCTGFTSQFVRLEGLNAYDARFVIVSNGPIDELVAYKEATGNRMPWYSCAGTDFGADVGAPAGGGFALNTFVRDGDRVFHQWQTFSRGVEQISSLFGLLDLLPYGRQEQWQDVPEGWPQSPTFTRWASSEDIAEWYGAGGERRADRD
jgi:predicted dithiol-disulfide oxidoreductase (DUF899 family)